MAFKKLPILGLTILYFLTLSISLSLSSDPNDVCNNTPHPNFCKSTLTKHKIEHTIKNYGRFFANESLYTAKTFKSLVKQNLRPSNTRFLSKTTVFALQDCQFLANTNFEHLSFTSDAVNSTDLDIDQVQTMLSATITNLDTCLDGLDSAGEPGSSVIEDLTPHIFNSTMLYSVTLAMFTQGWVLKSFHVRQLYSEHTKHNTQNALHAIPSGLFFNRKTNHSSFWPSKLNHVTRKTGYYGFHGRKLLQLGEMGITVNKMVVVNPNGNGNFTTINDAVASAPNNTQVNKGYFGIYVVAGVYEEIVVVPTNKRYLLMVGDGINQTIITGNRSVDGNWTTFNSATFAVTAPGFVAVNMTFRNTAGAIMHQAVAFRSGADLSAVYKCSFEGYQDTLYTHSMRQFYKECDIYGTVDFIFGNAAVVLQGCNIYPRQPLKGQFNAITAQGRTDPNQNTGTSIHNCMIEATNDLASSNYTVQTYLGRPWKEYSLTVYMQTYMGSLIQPAGWHDWSGTFALDTLYYAEYNNTGPGSNVTNRVTWLGYHVIDSIVASNFTVSSFLVGDFWLPSTGVPYTGGLL